MRKWLCLFVVALSALPIFAQAQDRESQWEQGTFVSVGRVGLDKAWIGADVQTYVGPVFSFNEDFSAMVGLVIDFGTSDQDQHRKVGLFIGGSVIQYGGIGYALDLIATPEAQPVMESRLTESGFSELVPVKYETSHSILLGTLIRSGDI